MRFFELMRSYIDSIGHLSLYDVASYAGVELTSVFTLVKLSKVLHKKFLAELKNNPAYYTLPVLYVGNQGYADGNVIVDEIEVGAQTFYLGIQFDDINPVSIIALAEDEVESFYTKKYNYSISEYLADVRGDYGVFC